MKQQLYLALVAAEQKKMQKLQAVGYQLTSRS